MSIEVSSVPEVYRFAPGEDLWIVDVVFKVPATSSLEALGAVCDVIARGQQ